jgi:hypothetical protein
LFCQNQKQEAIMPHLRDRAITTAVRDSHEDEAAYLAGWTISGLATLGTILAVWIFAV